MTTTTEKPGLIFKKIPAIMSEMPSIGKGRRNAQQGYAFRGIDDVYNLVGPLLAKHGVFMSAEILDDRHEERTSKQGSAMMYRVLKMRYSFVAEDGSSVSTDAVGEGMDSSDKASAKAMSIAQKYAILQMFLVPTEEPKPEPENDSHEVVPAAAPEPITADQVLVINKLKDDKKRNMEDVDAIVGKICDKLGIADFPHDLTRDEAAKLIAAWSKKAKS